MWLTSPADWTRPRPPISKWSSLPDEQEEEDGDDNDGDDNDGDDGGCAVAIGIARIKWFSSAAPTQCKESFQLIRARFMLINNTLPLDYVIISPFENTIIVKNSISLWKSVHYQRLFCNNIFFQVPLWRPIVVGKTDQGDWVVTISTSCPIVIVVQTIGAKNSLTKVMAELHWIDQWSS